MAKMTDLDAITAAIEETNWYHIGRNWELVDGANSELHTPLFKAADIFAALEKAHTVDAVEVVICRDCQHSTLPAVLTQRYGEPGTLTCHNRKSPCNKRNVKSDGFCPYGERRNDG